MKIRLAGIVMCTWACSGYPQAPDNLNLPPGGLFQNFREPNAGDIARALRDTIIALDPQSTLQGRSFDPGPLPTTTLPDGSQSITPTLAVAVAHYAADRDLGELRTSDEPAAVACIPQSIHYVRTFDADSTRWSTDQARDASSTAILTGSTTLDGSWTEDWTQITIPKEKRDTADDTTRVVDAMRAWLTPQHNQAHAYVLDVRVADPLDLRSSWIVSMLWTTATLPRENVVQYLDGVLAQRVAYPGSSPCQGKP